ncbi:hypothetical protein BESB_058800 [Besnoitia besnoiti]|uniref:START domain-containing protein n=1 Tax=Besnoitia besnoiti TaxID=94643 RepID=A0A2A9MH60_BESBE|nr:hypothetical protein BESB_058800 [Besnoitia besnoiti]PFH34993.1 hypothetical protein BESB_058800 [Besnoitia besnoiti]
MGVSAVWFLVRTVCCAAASVHALTLGRAQGGTSHIFPSFFDEDVPPENSDGADKGFFSARDNKRSAEGEDSGEELPHESPKPKKKRRRKHVPPRVPDTELDKFLHFAQDIRQGHIDPSWQPVVEGPPVSIWQRLIPGTNVYDYVAKGEFADISASAYNTTFNYLPFRATWDDSVVEIRILEVNPCASDCSNTTRPGGARGPTARHEPWASPKGEGARNDSKHRTCRGEGESTSHSDSRHPVASSVSSSGSGTQDRNVEEIIYWRVKLPWPLVDRDFVYARRFRVYPDSGAIVSVQQATVSGQCPEGPHAVRVESYNSTVVLFANNQENDLKRRGVSYVIYHFDASKTPVPPWVKNFFTTHTLPRTVSSLHDTAKQFVRDDGSIKPQAFKKLPNLKYHDVHQESGEDFEDDETDAKEALDGEKLESGSTGKDNAGKKGLSEHSGGRHAPEEQASDALEPRRGDAGPTGQRSPSKRLEKQTVLPSEPEGQQAASKSGDTSATAEPGNYTEAPEQGRGIEDEAVATADGAGMMERRATLNGGALPNDEQAIAEAYDAIWKGIPVAGDRASSLGTNRVGDDQGRCGLRCRGLKACVDSLSRFVRPHKQNTSPLAPHAGSHSAHNSFENSAAPEALGEIRPPRRPPSWCAPLPGVLVARKIPVSLRRASSLGVISFVSPVARAAQALCIVLNAQTEARQSPLLLRPSLAWPWWAPPKSATAIGDSLYEARGCSRHMRNKQAKALPRRDGGAWDKEDVTPEERMRRQGVLSLRTYAAVEALRWATRLSELDEGGDRGEINAAAHNKKKEGQSRRGWIDSFLVDLREDSWPPTLLSSVPFQRVHVNH